MSDLKKLFTVGGSSIVFALAIFSTVFNATNPEYNFPGITESLLIAVSFLLIALSLYSGRKITGREFFLGTILLFLIAILFLRYLWDLKQPGGEFATACFLMPGYFQKLECLLQLPFSVHYGLRQILFHVTALAVFMGAASLSRMSQNLRPWVILALCAPALVIAVSVLIPIYYDRHFSLVGYNFIFNSWWGYSRGKGIVANPSWLWPWLAPAISIALGGLFAKKWSIRILSIPIVVLCVWAALSVLQRGAYLLMGVLMFAVLLIFFISLLRRYSSLSVLKNTGLIVISAILLLFVIVQNAEYLITSYGTLTHTSIRHNPVSSGAGRLKMWSSAWKESQKHLITGSGYGTWLREAKKMRGVPAYDTAHNLWVQMFFELGVLHSSLIILTILLIGGNTLCYKNRDAPSLQAGAIFLSLSLLTVTLVQEIDYILPIYMQFALFAGMCFDGVSYDEKLDYPAPSSKTAYFILALGVFSFGFFIFYAKSISWGGSSYEPVHNSISKFNRWYRPKGAIAATQDRQQMKYTLYLGGSQKMGMDAFAPFGVKFPDIFVGQNALYLRNGSKWNPNQYLYEYTSQRENPQRLVSFSLYQPPTQSNTVLLAEQKTFPWEFNILTEEHSIKAGKWCKQSCQIILYGAGLGNKDTGVTLAIPVSGLNKENEVSITVKLQPLQIEEKYFLNHKYRLSEITSPTRSETFTFNDPTQVHTLHVNWESSSVWQLDFQADHSVVPGKYSPKVKDYRELGVFIIP